MSYYFTTELDCTYEEAIEKATEVLKSHGLGILTQIDVHEKFKEKLGLEFRRYKILGACSPKHAYKAISHEDKIGAMLPCNVVIQEHEPNRIEVTAIDPIASMQAVQNADLGEVAKEVQGMMRAVIEDLKK